jgi:hypothetical protein
VKFSPGGQEGQGRFDSFTPQMSLQSRSMLAHFAWNDPAGNSQLRGSPCVTQISIHTSSFLALPQRPSPP